MGLEVHRDGEHDGRGGPGNRSEPSPGGRAGDGDGQMRPCGRYRNCSPDVRGLYFVGAWTNTGGGALGVLCSAKVVENVLRRDGVVGARSTEPAGARGDAAAAAASGRRAARFATR